MINVGIIGLGFMGVTHFEAYRRHPLARVVALCDRSPERRRGEWGEVGGHGRTGVDAPVDLAGIRALADWRELIADPAIDLVDICVRTDLHRELAVAALAAGKHVLLEKPMAANSADARAIRDAAAAAPGFFMVAHCVRFWPEQVVARELVQAGTLGAVREIFMRRLTVRPGWAADNWFANAQASGGAPFDLHIHDVDYLLHLMGRPLRLNAWGEAGPGGGIDVVHAAFDFAGGTRANVIGGWACPAGFPFTKELFIRGERATLHYNPVAGLPLTLYAEDGISTPELPAGTGYDREIDHLLRAIEAGVPPTVSTAETALASVEMVEREIESLTSGRPVELPPA